MLPYNLVINHEISMNWNQHRPTPMIEEDEVVGGEEAVAVEVVAEVEDAVVLAEAEVEAEEAVIVQHLMTKVTPQTGIHDWDHTQMTNGMAFRKHKNTECGTFAMQRKPMTILVKSIKSNSETINPYHPQYRCLRPHHRNRHHKHHLPPQLSQQVLSQVEEVQALLFIETIMEEEEID